jgi:hypothetical protein
LPKWPPGVVVSSGVEAGRHRRDRWICSLDEHLRESNPAYVSAHDADSDGSLINGIRFARNQVVHKVAEVLEISAGAVLPVAPGSVLWELNWRAVADLPPPDPRRIARRWYVRRTRAA